MSLRVLVFAGVSVLATVSPAIAESSATANGTLADIEEEFGVQPSMAKWSATASGSLFYTDEVALFSATRRSGLDGDPSQPAEDFSRTGTGSDMVFEPDLRVSRLLTSSLGQTTLSIKAQGFLFAVNPEFSNASVTLDALHTFTPTTAVRLRYYTVPGELLGEIEEHRSGTDSLQDERVTSHIGSVRLDQHLSEHWEIQLFGRAGVRRFNEAFEQRDRTLLTIGPHLLWHVTDHSKFILGYHYERGLAEGRQQVQFEDDTSYVQHFASLGLEAELTEHLELDLDVHYERLNFTSGIPGDEHNGAHVNVFLGTGRLLYHLTDHAGLTLSFQRAQLRSNVELPNDHNTNVSAGIFCSF